MRCNAGSRTGRRSSIPTRSRPPSRASSFLSKVADTSTLILPIHFPTRRSAASRRTARASTTPSCASSRLRVDQGSKGPGTDGDAACHAPVIAAAKFDRVRSRPRANMKAALRPRRIAMTIESRIPSDMLGLTKAAPVSRRGFMSASAAAAAGYTLAAGPVNAQVVTTDTAGLSAGEAKVKVADGEMPVYFAKPANAQNPPVVLVAMEIFGLHEYIKDVATAARQSRGTCRCARLLFPQRRSDEGNRHGPAAAAGQFQAGRRIDFRSRRNGRMGEDPGRRHKPARHSRLLPRGAYRVGLFGDPTRT